MTVEDRIIQEFKDSAIWLNTHFVDLSIPSTIRHRVSLAYFDIVMENHAAIVLLIESRQYSPAYSLLRVIYESFVRGKWISKCASDDFLENFEKKEFPYLYEQLQEIKEIDASTSRVLSNLKNRAIKAMHDYTHIGHRAIGRRFNNAILCANYDDDEILEVLNFANAFGFIAALSACDVMDNSELSNIIFDKFQNYPIVGDKTLF